VHRLRIHTYTANPRTKEGEMIVTGSTLTGGRNLRSGRDKVGHSLVLVKVSVLTLVRSMHGYTFTIVKLCGLLQFIKLYLVLIC
jgi:hypothetical protein